MPRRRRSFGLSWSWRRAFGVSAAKSRISRAIGIPLTQSGRERKLGRMMGSGCLMLLVGSCCLGALLLAIMSAE